MRTEPYLSNVWHRRALVCRQYLLPDKERPP